MHSNQLSGHFGVGSSALTTIIKALFVMARVNQTSQSKAKLGAYKMASGNILELLQKVVIRQPFHSNAKTHRNFGITGIGTVLLKKKKMNLILDLYVMEHVITVVTIQIRPFRSNVQKMAHGITNKTNWKTVN